MRAARVFQSRGAVMGPYSSHLLPRCPTMLAASDVSNRGNSKRCLTRNRRIRSRWKPSTARGRSRRSSSETQPASRNGRLSRQCHSRQLTGSCLPAAYSGQFARQLATPLGRHGCATGRQCTSCAAYSGGNGRVRILPRLLTSDPLVAASGRDVKGSWCLGSGRCVTTTFSSAPELSPDTAAAAREKSRAGFANAQPWWTPWRAPGQLRLFRRFATTCHAADVEGAAVAISHCCEDQSRCEYLWKPEVRRRLRVHPPLWPSDPHWHDTWRRQAYTGHTPCDTLVAWLDVRFNSVTTPPASSGSSAFTDAHVRDAGRHCPSTTRVRRAWGPTEPTTNSMCLSRAISFVFVRMVLCCVGPGVTAAAAAEARTCY